MSNPKIEPRIAPGMAPYASAEAVGAFACVPLSRGKESDEMDAARRQRILQFDPLYDWDGELGEPCRYCGLISSVWDHVPPLHFVERMAEQDRNRAHLRKIPSCAECNSILRGLILRSTKDRRAYVKARLRKKYGGHLEMPNWDEKELAELSTEDARNFIRRHLRVANLIRQRLGFHT